MLRGTLNDLIKAFFKLKIEVAESKEFVDKRKIESAEKMKELMIQNLESAFQ